MHIYIKSFIYYERIFKFHIQHFWIYSLKNVLFRYIQKKIFFIWKFYCNYRSINFYVSFHFFKMSTKNVSCCGGCANKCAVCGASGVTGTFASACQNCRNSRKFGSKCPVCGGTIHNSTASKLCSKCRSKHKVNTCDFCGGK